jgi:hypothetical protein
LDVSADWEERSTVRNSVRRLTGAMVDVLDSLFQFFMCLE